VKRRALNTIEPVFLLESLASCSPVSAGCALPPARLSRSIDLESGEAAEACGAAQQVCANFFSLIGLCK
jgi:hypothetical protein